MPLYLLIETTDFEKVWEFSTHQIIGFKNILQSNFTFSSLKTKGTSNTHIFTCMYTHFSPYAPLLCIFVQDCQAWQKFDDEWKKGLISSFFYVSQIYPNLILKWLYMNIMNINIQTIPITQQIKIVSAKNHLSIWFG